MSAPLGSPGPSGGSWRRQGGGDRPGRSGPSQPPASSSCDPPHWGPVHWQGFCGRLFENVPKWITRLVNSHDPYIFNTVNFSASNKRVKPIDIRKIEHEDFIDYEIEFIELPAHEENETGTEEFILKTESSNSITSNNEIQNGSLKTENSENKSEKSKELNLVNFVDLLRKTKARAKPSRSRAGGDRRRRRRIKLKRDPGRSGSSRASLREINGFSNQINTEQSKRDQNNLRFGFPRNFNQRKFSCHL